MINAQMRYYDYFTFGEVNSYGQPQISAEPQGRIKMAIYITSQSVQDNINYKDCKYIGLTTGAIDDSCVIKYGNESLKVLYVNPQGRLKQVFLGEI
jgi:hypothetical protein